MVYAAIGGMQLKHWSGWFKIILPTLRVLKAAKKTDGCVHGVTYKAGNVYFAVSVWSGVEHMQAFARGGLHGQLMRVGMDEMAMFYNHTQEFEDVPSQVAMTATWHAAMAARNGKGTIGVYSA